MMLRFTYGKHNVGIFNLIEKLCEFSITKLLANFHDFDIFHKNLNDYKKKFFFDSFNGNNNNQKETYSINFSSFLSIFKKNT